MSLDLRTAVCLQAFRARDVAASFERFQAPTSASVRVALRRIAGVRGPPITLTCDCGQATSLRYGARWTCPGCGRVWDTAEIPKDEYAGLARDLRLYRALPIAIAVGLVLVFLPLVVFVKEVRVLVVPVLLGALAIFLGPLWKTRVRRRFAATPNWDLRPE
jgi:hypothetical protein